MMILLHIFSIRLGSIENFRFQACAAGSVPPLFAFSDLKRIGALVRYSFGHVPAEMHDFSACRWNLAELR